MSKLSPSVKSCQEFMRFNVKCLPQNVAAGNITNELEQIPIKQWNFFAGLNYQDQLDNLVHQPKPVGILPIIGICLCLLLSINKH